MEVVFRVSGDILIANIKGEVDHHSAMPLRKSMDNAMKAFECRHLVMDFNNVNFMDSSGIGVVLGRYKKITASGGTVYVSGCSEYIEKILDMSGVFSLISKSDDFQDAVCRINGQEQISMGV